MRKVCACVFSCDTQCQAPPSLSFLTHAKSLSINTTKCTQNSKGHGHGQEASMHCVAVPCMYLCGAFSQDKAPLRHEEEQDRHERRHSRLRV